MASFLPCGKLVNQVNNMKTIQILNNNQPEVKITVNWCSSFFSKLKGLMFVPSLQDNTGIILVDSLESRINTAIHMLFMNFDITTVWINKKRQVVDVAYAKKWHLSYFPKKSAQYVLEINISHINDFHIGDQLTFSNEK
jgi:uncharacterized membrane protein (UPF0127 family)